jgi:hypothetical protein
VAACRLRRPYVDETMVEANLGERIVMMRMDRPLQDFVDAGK